MRRNHLLWGVIILILGSFIYFGVERWASIQKKEYQIKADRQSEIKANRLINKGLESSSLFGIRLGDSAVALRLSLEYGVPNSGIWESEDIKKVTEQPSGIIKGTTTNNLAGFGFVLKLNDFIDPSIHDGVYINLNNDFEDYYIKYQPYGTGKIHSIIASLKTEWKSDGHETCVKDLRPYAIAVAERIKKENLFERIVIVDNFYPKIDGEHNYPEIFFKNNKFKSTGEYILVIKGWCQVSTKEAFLELAASRLGVPYEKWSKIMKSITEQKELDLKKEFNDDANKEKKIDKSGL